MVGEQVVMEITRQQRRAAERLAAKGVHRHDVLPRPPLPTTYAELRQFRKIIGHTGRISHSPHLTPDQIAEFGLMLWDITNRQLQDKKRR